MLFGVGLGLVILLALVFMWAFWVNTRPEVQARPPARKPTILLLVVQLAAGLSVDTDLLFLAAQLGFLYPNRTACVGSWGQRFCSGGLIAAALSGVAVDVGYHGTGAAGGGGKARADSRRWTCRSRSRRAKWRCCG
ncbi:MAG: hypothetical protein R2762_27975 [Bryobacteraceae bacterium]